MCPSAATASVVRDVTDQEIEFYREHGWVKLEGFVDPATVERMLIRLKAKMGEDASADAGGGYSDDAATSRPAAARALFNSYEGLSAEEQEFRAVSMSAAMGRALSRLADDGVRFWDDMALVKMPVEKAGGKTPWHQDMPYYPFDRLGMLNLWLALVDVPPEMGTMRFVEGSHRWGPLGRVIHRTDGVDTVDLLPPDLKDKFEVSPPLRLVAGDATVHNLMTIHSAPENRTHDPRWAYVLTVFPDQALYTGAPHRNTDGLGLTVNERLEHERFPLLPR